MDGYAVRAADVATVPAVLEVIGESSAGGTLRGRGRPWTSGAHLHRCQCARGRRRRRHPGGCGARRRQPQRARGGQAGRQHPPRRGRFPRRRHAPARRAAARCLGDHRWPRPAATPGSRYGARPCVAILATGDELVEPGRTPGPGQIVSSNPYGLAALVRRFGGGTVAARHRRATRCEDLQAKLAARPTPISS